MKRTALLLAVLILCCSQVAAQTRYLVNVTSPVKSYMYEVYKYSGPNSKKIHLSGGLSWQGGFTIGSSQGPYQPGYATFRLGGAYETLLFVLGLEDESYEGDPRVVTVYADGRKVVDEVVRQYGIPKRIRVDVTGVDELKFVLVTGEGTIGFGEVTLWKAGETPRETGNLISGSAKTTQLIRDLRPYAQNNHFVVSPDDEYKTVFVNGNKYHYGIVCNMNMAFIGVQPGCSYFNLRGQYETLSLLAGPVNNDKSSGGKGWITVKADGRILHEYEISQDDIARRIVLDVTGCHQLSFHTEQANQSMYAAIVDATLYPAGAYAESGADEDAVKQINPRLKELPDVCKLVSNIPPYAVGGQVEHQVYNGESDHITFSMGGQRFSEGFILYEKADFWNDNIVSYAVFDLGREFDYVSFTAGYVGKSWSMTNDVIRVYADDELLLEAPMMATYPNQHFTLPIKRCRKLRFENGGSGNLNVGAYGIADIVVYRGKPVENDLFVHPTPECPSEIDLIDLGAPYIHYVSTQADNRDGIFYDGSTQRRYFEMPDGTRINKGFMLQTSVHFSLDHGVLAGTDNAAAGAIGGAAVGSAFVAGAAVGGAIVGSTLIGAAAFLMLAAGGNAVENSCAAFNTYGAYNSVTFTVACLRPFAGSASDYKETLLIGADQRVVAELTVYETMEPQTATVPIDGCEQLMFWLANTYNTSGQYVFYDIRLTRDRLELSVPKEARLSKSVVTEPLYTEKKLAIQWKRPAASGVQSVDAYLSDCSKVYGQTVELVEQTKPFYKIYTYYLETASGAVCKAVSLRTDEDHFVNMVREYETCVDEMKRLRNLKADLTNLGFAYVNANLGLPELGLRAIAFGKLLKSGRQVARMCNELVMRMIEEKQQELFVLESLLGNARNIDGVGSTEYTVLCPLASDETPPTDQLQLLTRFSIR